MSTEVKPTDWDAEDNRWEPTPSGGGSGLPAYTSADKGKVLTIGEGEGSVTTVIVPEQSVAIRNVGDDKVSIYMGVVSSVNVSGLADGATVVFSFNGNEYDTTYDKANNECYSDDICLQYSNRRDEWELTVPPVTEGNYTVSAYTSVPSVEPKWEAASGGGVINVNVGEVSAAGNSADMAIFVDGTELSSYNACHEYLASIKDSNIHIALPIGWTAPVLFFDDGNSMAFLATLAKEGSQVNETRVGWVGGNT